MKAVFDDRRRRHDPRHFMASGVIRPGPEQPGRIEALHSPGYITFLRNTHARWHLAGHVDPDEDIHSPPPPLFHSKASRPCRRHLAERWIARPDQRSRRISEAGEMQPEPSRAASMISIPASLPSPEHAPDKAGAEAQMKGKAA